MTIGEKLKEEERRKVYHFRRSRMLSRSEKNILRALENNDFDVSGEAYVGPFIKSYGNHLGLDGEELVEEYKRLIEEERKLQEEEK